MICKRLHCKLNIVFFKIFCTTQQNDQPMMWVLKKIISCFKPTNKDITRYFMYSVTLNTFVDTNNYKITSLLWKRTMCVCMGHSGARKYTDKVCKCFVLNLKGWKYFSKSLLYNRFQVDRGIHWQIFNLIRVVKTIILVWLLFAAAAFRDQQRNPSSQPISGHFHTTRFLWEL